MADRYDDRDRFGDQFYGRDWYDRDSRDWQRERERMDREAQSRDDRSGYRLGDTDSGRWRDSMDDSRSRSGQGRGDWERGDSGSGGQGYSGRPDRWRSRDMGGHGGDWGRMSSSGMSGHDDRDRQGRMSGDLGRQPAFDNYSGAGRDWGSDQGSWGGRGGGGEQRGWGGQQQGSGQGERVVYAARGQHVGKGPRGYQRSDERIREEVSDALSDHGDIDASDIEVKVQGGEVTLSGTVSDRGQKRLAEDCAEQVRGVRDVHNQLRVQRDGQGSSMGGANVGGIMGEQMQGAGTRSGQQSGGQTVQSNEVIGNSAPGTSSAIGGGQDSRG